MSTFSTHPTSPATRAAHDTPTPAASGATITPVHAGRESCCGSSDFGRLGRCMRCVVLASLLVPLGWTGFYLTRRHHSPGWLAYPVLVLSALFSILLVAHALAFLRNRQEAVS